ncbi:hypothetical protein GA0061098_101652 [Bradyrhizobium shewense]|uniref:Uncharacterized protein n=1 Tax=Bradyrhizobium shewense TaxID=1761772 RepID=A0A1C3XHP4_9BRAD|nr:hypothetical protein GA0061098_101652 [Bradyrhizobium shewense]
MEFPRIPVEVTELWSALVEQGKSLVFEASTLPKPPKWWEICYGLMVIADEASADAGYVHVEGKESNNHFAVTVDFILRRAADAVTPSDRHRRIDAHIASICTRADRDVVCVQPKSHTPEVGCTPRVLAHNLALLPPRGEMRVHWQRPPCRPLPEAQVDLKLLLIPYPYEIPDEAFQAEPVSTPAEVANKTRAKPWGWFSLDQTWLPSDPAKMVQYVEALIAQAKKKTTHIHAVMFPEYALNWACYEAIANHLRDFHPDVEFLLAGSSENCAGIKGNFSLSSHFFDEKGPDGEQVRLAATTSSGKHHRWRLDRHQLNRYALLERLDPNYMWWEKMAITQRDIYVKVIRSASVFTTLICEDLARSDPCHEVLRSIGSNLVFVLLMDGPQLIARWPGRYATALSDDPGCSVLTFTSRALIKRSNETEKAKDKKFVESWSVGLWKDAEGSAKAIPCATGSHAVVIAIHGTPHFEAALDGRQNADAVRWKMTGDPLQVKLAAKDANKLLKSIKPES